MHMLYTVHTKLDNPINNSTPQEHYKHKSARTCIDQVGILLALSWIGSHSQKPVLGLQHHMYPGRDIIARHSGHPDTYMMRERVEWDVE